MNDTRTPLITLWLRFVQLYCFVGIAMIVMAIAGADNNGLVVTILVMFCSAPFVFLMAFCGLYQVEVNRYNRENH